MSPTDPRPSSPAAWLIYPAVMTGAYALFVLLRAVGAPLVAATYVPIVLTAGAIALCEWRWPYRAAWVPGRDEVRLDITFLAVVQLMLPPLVSLLFLMAIVEPARALRLPVQAWWPHGWPVGAQVVLMILTVDFLRYWLHRAAHETDLLWRLHKVHHSVEQLYWLNTSRFHPIEKALQMLLDSVPFVLMAVDPVVLALYYLSDATNGFFQHCNIDLRYGLLNYVVGSAETHRWHHSREPREANANYGNTVIVWDLLFGTWFLPADRAIGDLGLHQRLPASFTALMAAPFRK
ncbi:MAG: sterol desaturase family protein [Vicinamibacterales bacterium]